LFDRPFATKTELTVNWMNMISDVVITAANGNWTKCKNVDYGWSIVRTIRVVNDL